MTFRGFAALLAAFVPFFMPVAHASDWGHYGGDGGGSRFSTLDQITPENVASLERAWVYSTGDYAARGREEMLKGALETTPILKDGRLYLCSAFNEVIALHPGTGEELWRFDPAVATDRRPGNQYTCRGVVYWEDPEAEDAEQCSARIFTGTVDSRVIALDATTGLPCDSFGKRSR